MDYLDFKKALRHRVILLVGYVFVAIGIGIATIILIELAYGFGLAKNGTVIQNGWVFISSQPSPAKIYLNGKSANAATNTRLSLPAANYNLKLTRTGYRDWQRTITLDGGSIEHFDYPLLVPKILVTKKIKTYDTAPGFTTQSPDRRWLLVQQPGSMTGFEVYDLKNPAKAPVAISLPDNLLSKATTHEDWQLDEWADDNQHVLLQHDYDDKTEFVLIDRTAPDQSLNLNTVLSLNPTKLTLDNKKYDHYYVYDQSAATLATANLKAPSSVPVLDHVLAYQSYSDNTLLYVSDGDQPTGKVEVLLKTGSQTSLIRGLPAGTSYLLDLTKYSGTMYVAAGAASQNKVYIYRDPVGQLGALPGHAVTPAQVLHVEQPNYLSFSTNAQFIVAENGPHFGVYDIENKLGYNYSARQTLDAPQVHASWMDGDRLTYVSGNKLVIFDYDDTNTQVLMAASSDYLPAFAPDYKDVYDLAGSAGSNETALTDTSLLLPADR